MSHIVVVDDRSERVKYYGPWTHDTVGDDAWDATLSIASEKGAGAVFEFYGTYVYVNGGILLKESAGPVPPASFAIDGGEPHTFTAPDSYNATWANTLYGSDALADGPHTLNITLLGSGSPWLFDVFLYNGTEEATTTTTTAVSTKTAAVTEQLMVVNTVFATPSASIAAPAQGASRAAVPVGPIVGGIVGGVALLVCAAMAFYFLYWKRRTRGRPYYYERTEKADLFDTADLHPPVHVYHYQRAAMPSTASLAQSPSTLRLYSKASLTQSPSTPRPYSIASLAQSPTTPRPYSITSLALPPSPSTARPRSYSTATPRLEPYAALPALPTVRSDVSLPLRDEPRIRQDSAATSAPSVYSASSMSRTTSYTVTNPDADDDVTADGHTSGAVPVDALTPAQRKAAEALADRLATVQQHMDVDAGFRRFDDAGAAGSGETLPAVVRVPDEVLPVYSEK